MKKLNSEIYKIDEIYNFRDLVNHSANKYPDNVAYKFKKNLGKYLLLAETVDIFITRNGKVVAKLTNPNQDRVNRAESSFGILSDHRTLEESKKERLSKI